MNVPVTLHRLPFLLSIVLALSCHLTFGTPSDNEQGTDVPSEEIRRAKVMTSSFGRILTWNVKKLGACLQQDNVEQLKQIICVILKSANLIVLQEASNLDFSCLPCNAALRDDYAWHVDGGLSNDFKILVKTKRKKSIRVIKEGTCKRVIIPQQNKAILVNKMSAPFSAARPVMSPKAPVMTLNSNPVTKKTVTVNVEENKENELDSAHKLVDKLLVDYIQSEDFQADMNRTSQDDNSTTTTSDPTKQQISDDKNDAERVTPLTQKNTDNLNNKLDGDKNVNKDQNEINEKPTESTDSNAGENSGVSNKYTSNDDFKGTSDVKEKKPSPNETSKVKIDDDESNDNSKQDSKSKHKDTSKSEKSDEGKTDSGQEKPDKLSKKLSKNDMDDDVKDNNMTSDEKSKKLRADKYKTEDENSTTDNSKGEDLKELGKKVSNDNEKQDYDDATKPGPNRFDHTIKVNNRVGGEMESQKAYKLESEKERKTKKLKNRDDKTSEKEKNEDEKENMKIKEGSKDFADKENDEGRNVNKESEREDAGQENKNINSNLSGNSYQSNKSDKESKKLTKDEGDKESNTILDVKVDDDKEKSTKGNTQNNIESYTVDKDGTKVSEKDSKNFGSKENSKVDLQKENTDSAVYNKGDEGMNDNSKASEKDPINKLKKTSGETDNKFANDTRNSGQSDDPIVLLKEIQSSIQELKEDTSKAKSISKEAGRMRQDNQPSVQPLQEDTSDEKSNSRKAGRLRQDSQPPAQQLKEDTSDEKSNSRKAGRLRQDSQPPLQQLQEDTSDEKSNSRKAGRLRQDSQPPAQQLQEDTSDEKSNSRNAGRLRQDSQPPVQQLKEDTSDEKSISKESGRMRQDNQPSVQSLQEDTSDEKSNSRDAGRMRQDVLNNDLNDGGFQNVQYKTKERKYDSSNSSTAYADVLKSRLLASKARLQGLDSDNDKFKTIENQIRFIERELTQLDSPRLKEGELMVKSTGKNNADRLSNNENESNLLEQDNPSKKNKDVINNVHILHEWKRPRYEDGHHTRETQEVGAKRKYTSLVTLPQSNNLKIDSEEMHKLIRKIIIEKKYNGDGEKFNKQLAQSHGDDKEMIKNFIKETTKKELEDEIVGRMETINNRKKREVSQQSVFTTQSFNGSSRNWRRKMRNHMNGGLRKQRNSHKVVRDFQISKRQFTPKQSNDVINYNLILVTSDLNAGEPFLVINLRLPKVKNIQMSCIDAIKADVQNYNQDKKKVFIMGDFHLDKMSSADQLSPAGVNHVDLYQVLANLQINGENFHSPITYNNRDPITTVFGRRYDNIITNVNVRENFKVIGPEFPMMLESLILPLTLQRLYNNYITSLYNTGNSQPETIYDCIKAYLTGGPGELQNNVCSRSWVPSSYVSDHLPLELSIKMKVYGRAPFIELKFASWNVQGDTLKERLQDPVVKKKFQEALNRYQVVIFNHFLPDDASLQLDNLPGEIVRLKQGELVTDFSIFINEYVKDKSKDESQEDTEMFVMKKKATTANTGVLGREDNLVSTVGLFTPSLIVNGESMKGCFYTVRNNDGTINVDFKKIMNAIDKDVKMREGCDFKILLASLYIDGNFNLDKELYDNYKYINLDCNIVSGDKKYKYNVPRSRDITDYIIVLDKSSKITFGDCSIGLPGDERFRGVDELSDFEELSTHYPLSIMIRDANNG